MISGYYIPVQGDLKKDGKCPMFFLMMMNFVCSGLDAACSNCWMLFLAAGGNKQKEHHERFRCRGSLDQIITEKRIHCALVHLASALLPKSILVAMFTFAAKRHIPSQDLIASTLEILWAATATKDSFPLINASLACIRNIISAIETLPDSYCSGWSIKQWIDTPHSCCKSI